MWILAGYTFWLMWGATALLGFGGFQAWGFYMEDIQHF